MENAWKIECIRLKLTKSTADGLEFLIKYSTFFFVSKPITTNNWIENFILLPFILIHLV
jgi:hypothetical protein